jgi:hypothetical protein
MSNSKGNVANINKQLIVGLQQYYAKKTLVLLGTPWASTAIISALQKEDQLVASTAAARSAWQTQVAALRAQAAANKKLRTELHAAVIVNLGTNPTALGAFGYSAPKKTGQRSPQVKVVAAQKAAATRVARHTMSRKQKLAIHGGVATQPAAQLATEVPAQPAPNAPVTTK